MRLWRTARAAGANLEEQFFEGRDLEEKQVKGGSNGGGALIIRI